MTHTYRSSPKAVTTLAIALVLVLVFASFLSLASRAASSDSFKGLGILVGVFAFVIFGVSLSKIEIDDEARTISFRNNYISYGPVSIDKIIQIGYPEQSYLVKSINSFVYVWYDDPSKPGKDKYLKIPDVQFGPQTIAQIARKLKEVNENIKLDDQVQKLLVGNVR